MEMEKAELDVLLKQVFRFNPSPEDVVTFYLPRLIAGQNPHDTEGYIHNAIVYGAQEPKDLAAQFAPVLRSTNGDRFFFTGCNKIKGRASRGAGGGTWVLQSSKDVLNREGIKIGEVKNFRFQKKEKKFTDWLMEEYRVCFQETGDFVEPVLCRIYISPRAKPNSAVHQESAAALAPPPPIAPPRQVPVMVAHQQAAPLKRPPPIAPVAEPPPCAKRMRGAISPSMASAPRPPRRVPPQSQRVMAPAPPPPPAALVIGGQHTAQSSVPQNVDGTDMEEVMKFLRNGLYMTSDRPVQEEEAEKNDKPEEVRVLAANSVEHDDFAKSLEEMLEATMEENSLDNGNDNLQKVGEHDVPNDDESDDGDFWKKLLEDELQVDDERDTVGEVDHADEIALPVAPPPPVMQTIAPNDDEPHNFNDEDMDDLRKSMEDKLDNHINGDDETQKEVGVGNGSEGDEGRVCEDAMLPPPIEEEKDDKVQEPFLDVLEDINFDETDEEIFNMPLKDYNDYLSY